MYVPSSKQTPLLNTAASAEVEALAMKECGSFLDIVVAPPSQENGVNNVRNSAVSLRKYQLLEV